MIPSSALQKAKLHVEAGVSASRPWTFETILISMFLQHEKALFVLKSKVKTHEDQGGEYLSPFEVRGGKNARIYTPKSLEFQYTILEFGS